MNITKLKILNIINLLLFISLIISVVLHFTINAFGLELFDFAIVVIFLSTALSLFAKSILFKSDNALWFALLLFIYSGFQIYFAIYPTAIEYKWFLYVIAVVPCSLGVLVFFKELFSLKLAILALVISLPLYINWQVNLKIWAFLMLLVLAIILGYLLQRLIPLKRKAKRTYHD